jgi:hypothetical protein
MDTHGSCTTGKEAMADEASAELNKRVGAALELWHDAFPFRFFGFLSLILKRKE